MKGCMNSSRNENNQNKTVFPKAYKKEMILSLQHKEKSIHFLEKAHKNQCWKVVLLPKNILLQIMTYQILIRVFQTHLNHPNKILK